MGRIALWALVVSLSGLVVPASGDTRGGTGYRIQDTTTKPGGTLTADEVWTAADGPYLVTGTIFISDGCTLTIRPGTSVYLAAGASLIVVDGGRLLAEGTEAQPIQFAAPPGAGTSWGGLTIEGSAGSPESRLAYVSFAGHGKTCIQVSRGTLSLDHATFGTTTHTYVALEGASFLVSHCHFPAATARFEMLKGTAGIKAGGRGVIRDCFFGRAMGYSDAVDHNTGGNREQNQPVIQFYNNVFAGSDDDILDIDGADAWIEGNIFLHCHRNNTPDTAAAISGGSGSRTSEITVLGNLFFDCDNVATAKQGNFYTFLNNTMVRTTRQGGIDTAAGVVAVRDMIPNVTTFARGAYLEGNIIVDAEQLIRNYDEKKTTVTLHNNILPLPWTGPGSGNIVVDPMLRYLPEVAETRFTTWQQAQVLREWFSLQPGSPARGTGPNGTDKGGVIPLGVSISGEPRDLTSLTSATLTVGINRTGFGIPTAGFPLGSGFTHYRWRLDGGAWSPETPLAAPIQLTGLAAGPHRVEAVGKNDAGWYQDDPALGPNAVVTASRPWTVDAAHQRLVINEVLAVNRSLAHAGTLPGLVELYYDGAAPLDLSGMSLMCGAANPAAFVFPTGSTIAPGKYLLLYAGPDSGTSGLHLGFDLDGAGDALSLCNRLGEPVDAVIFGRQLPDLSIGRAGRDDTWCLMVPTPGQANTPQPVGDPGSLRINEWLASPKDLFSNGFIELYNPSPDPVDLGSMVLTDGPGTPLPEARIVPLSFMPGHGHEVFQADGGAGFGHVPFHLSPSGGTIRLLDGQSREIDRIVYGPQAADVSAGRTPDGAELIEFFPLPTPGAANPEGPKIVTIRRMLVEERADKRVLVPAGAIGEDWKGGKPFDDASWRLCQGSPGGVGFETGAGYQALITLDVQTQMYGAGRNNTCYIRVPFTVAADTRADANGLTLNVRYDDAFVAYLNGRELARRNFTGTPAWNSRAASSREASVEEVDESIDVTQFLADLKAGANLLAIHGMNSSSTSSDFLITVSLDAVVTEVQDP
ncbi:MAG: lamin tail domain-containing protein [Planctomycetes bacterium]|nr:lamin tail domain-containing protein [Planctomycetota bacterium]